MNELTKKTPIEVVLKIDDEGYTTASAVYEWLELNPVNFARWCKKNIVNNDYAAENADYFPFFLEEERNPKPKIDYKLTIMFAGKLCMASHTPRGEEAREYFARSERLLKVGAQKAIEKMNQIVASYQKELEEIRSQQKLLEEKTDDYGVRLCVMESGTIAYQPSRWVKFIMDRIALLAKHYRDGRTGELYDFKRMLHSIMDELERRYPGFNDDLHEGVKVYENNTGRTDGKTHTIQVIDYCPDLRWRFNNYVNNELYDMGVIDPEEDEENPAAMLRNLYPGIPRF